MFSVCRRSFLTPLWWKNLLAPRAFGFCVVTRKFGSLFFALLCFSFDWRLFIVQTARLFLPVIGAALSLAVGWKRRKAKENTSLYC